MQKVRKAHGDKVILDDVTLNFLPGAKIGVVGPNGAGKSTRPEDHGGAGARRTTARPTSSREHGRDPPAGAAAERGEDRPRERRGGSRRDQDPARPVQRDRRADGHRLLRRAHGGDRRAAGGPGPRRRVGDRLAARAGDGRAALPAAGVPVSDPVRRRAAPGGAVQAAAEQARSAPARRADQPPRRRERAVARAAPRVLRRRGPGRDPRPLLPRQRRAVDPRDRPRPHLPVRGQLLDLPGEEGRAPRGAGSEGREAAEAAESTSWPGCVRARRHARPRAARGSSATRRWRRRPSGTASSTSRRSRSRRARGSATSSSRSRTWTRASTGAC